MIRVLTVDDHPLLREGIAVLIDTQADMQLIAEASNGREALEQFVAACWHGDRRNLSQHL